MLQLLCTVISQMMSHINLALHTLNKWSLLDPKTQDDYDHDTKTNECHLSGYSHLLNTVCDLTVFLECDVRSVESSLKPGSYNL